MNLVWILVFVAVTIVVAGAVVLRRKPLPRREDEWWETDSVEPQPVIVEDELPDEDDFPAVEIPPVLVETPAVIDDGYSRLADHDGFSADEKCLSEPVTRHFAQLPMILAGDLGNDSIQPLDAKISVWPSLDLPFAADGPDPLPRSGLFIRRNNAFGTRATLGIADLIDQGVLIDQTQIRFDDFIAANTSGIPEPAPGEALSVSCGMRAAEENFRVNGNTTHLLELALRTGDIPRNEPSSRESLPLNLVFVVDTSGSMHGTKLDTVKAAIRELYSQLRDDDVLGIVTFDTEVRTTLKATTKREISADRLDAVVTGLEADGGTDINLGVLYGIDELARHSHSETDPLSCLYLFSDGEPNSGERNWITIRRNIADRIRGDLTLSCFAFGADARVRELEALAGLTGGSCTVVTDPDDVRLNLTEDLARREHLAAINVQLRIQLDADVTAWHFYGHDLITDPSTRARVERDVAAAKHRARDQIGVESLPDLVTEDDGIRLFVPDLAFGETYWVVLELRAKVIQPGFGKAERAGFGKAAIQYVDAVARENRRHVLDLATATTIDTETVFTHAVGLWTSEVVFHALEDLYHDDRAAAVRRLTGHVETLRAAHALIPARQFHEDQVTFRKLITLANNLGLTQAWTDAREGVYTVFAMNRFGQSRSGFLRNRYS
ncbi:von Willebrand factor type A domain-containing protein [Lentzea aerocolonigenes]|nr:von Willebrand factor type A domain-containing protein [Lentzea aerocolonigenes]